MIRITLLTLSALALPLAFAQDTNFRVKQMRDSNPNGRDGKCVIRVMVDDEVDVELQGDTVLVRRITGQAGRDDGSECTQPLPQSYFQRFQFRGIDGRGEVKLVQEPRPGNGFVAIVSIKDKRGGTEGYTFELSWSTDGSRYSGSMGGGGNYSSGNTGGYNYPNRGGGGGGGILPSLGGGNNNNGGFGNRAPQFSGINETSTGNGAIRQGTYNDTLRRARVTLNGNGDAEIQLYGSEVLTLRGRWTGQADNLQLQITDGFGNAGANGNGRVYLTRDGRFSRLEIQGKTARYSDAFDVQFNTGR